MHESAEELIETTGWIDFPRSHQCSIAYEVMSSLALLNHQWITVDDIPELLSVLELGRKDPKLAWARWEKFWTSSTLMIEKDNYKVRITTAESEDMSSVPNKSLQPTLDPAAPLAVAKAPSASSEAELKR